MDTNSSPHGQNVNPVSILKNLLRTNRVAPGASLAGTHVSMVVPKGKFRFNHESITHFWNEFCGMTAEQKSQFGLAERSNERYLPVLGDIDLKVRDDPETLPEFIEKRIGNVNHDESEYPSRVLYSETEAKKLIKIYQNVLREVVENCSDKMLQCVLLEKPMYKTHSGGSVYVKNGFHLHFPWCFLSRQDLNVHVYPRIQQEVQGLFAYIGLDDPLDIVDSAVTKNAWLLYGCVKEGSRMKPYQITTVYDHELKKVSPREAFKKYKLYDLSSGDRTSFRDPWDVMPRILSIFLCHRKTQQIKTTAVAPFHSMPPNETVLEETLAALGPPNPGDMEKAQELISLISGTRAETYQTWFTIGCIVKNISHGSRDGYELWDQFSRRSSAYDEAGVIDTWRSLTVRSKPGIGSLIHFAKIDNPDGYAKYRTKIIKGKLDDTVSLGATHCDMARMLHIRFRGEFVCASITGRSWYQFRNHIWQPVEEGTTLRSKISGEIYECYQKEIDACRLKMAKPQQGEYEQAVLKTRHEKLSKIMSNLKSNNFKSAVMREAMEVFYDYDFQANLDTNKYLVAFQNGVYDLTTNEFRGGLPEDYLSKALPIKYLEKLTIDSAPVRDVKTFLEQVFPDRSVRKFFLDAYSQIFVGGNENKWVIFWTGEGNNGKSVTQGLIEKMLGPLAIKFETTLLTGKKAGMGKAAPELSRAAPPVRHAVLEEPEKGEQINCGRLKQMSGSDSYFARDLYQAGKAAREIEPQFTLTFICNSLPDMRNPDRATWNRIRVIPFESTFIDPGLPCPEEYEEQLRQKKFPQDRRLHDKIPCMLPAFAWYLLHHRRTEVPEPPPPKVLEATRKYEISNDKIKLFIEEMLESAPTETIAMGTVWTTFREWQKENFPAHTQDRPSIKNYFTKTWGALDKNQCWKGWRLKRCSVADDDAISGGVPGM